MDGKRFFKRFSKEKGNRIFTHRTIITHRTFILILTGLLAAGTMGLSRCSRVESEKAPVSAGGGKEDETKITPSDVELLKAQLLKTAQEQISELTKRFEKKLEETVSYYESRIGDLDKQHHREIQELKEHYEALVRLTEKNHADEIDRIVLTYNPFFLSADLISILEREVDRDIPDTPVLKSYRNILHEEKLLSPEDFKKLRIRLADVSALIDRLQEIPYTNSISAALEQIEQIALTLVRDYEDIWSRAAELIERKNLKIKQFSDSLDYLVKKKRENGYVIDSTDTDRIAVHINRMHMIGGIGKLKDGDLGYVFRADDEPVGTILFSVSSDGVTASLVQLVSPDQPIQPFDKILMDLY